MNCKNIKRIMIVIFVGIITFGINNSVYAKDVDFPSYTKADRDFLNTSTADYCEYTLMSDFAFHGLGIYQGKKIIIHYDKTGDKLQYLIPIQGTWADSGTTWSDDNAIILNHSYMVNGTATYLKNYLVNNGQIECKKIYLYTNADNNLYLTADYDEQILAEFGYSTAYQNPAGAKSCGTSIKSTLEADIEKLLAEFTTYVNSKINNIPHDKNYQYYKNLIQQEQKEFNSRSSDLTTDTVNVDIIPRKKYDLNQKLNSLFKKYSNECNIATDSSYIKTKNEYFQKKLEEISKPYLEELSKVIIELQNAGTITSNEANNLNTEVSKANDSYEKDCQVWISDINEALFGQRLDNEPIQCEGLLGEKLLGHIRTIFTWIRIFVPVLLIILGSVDFGKAVLNDDPKALQKAGKDFVKRCIAAVAIFFAPLIIMYLIEIIDKAIPGISGVSCDVRGL